MKKYLIFDASNFLYRNFFAHPNEDDITIAGLAHHSALVTMHKYFREFRPDKIVMAFDRPSWRKQYTASEDCLSKRPYKGNRRQNMTPKQQEKFLKFMEHVKEFEAILNEHTAIWVLSGDLLEADDLIAGFVRRFDQDEKIVVSTDDDFLQLLRYPNTTIYDPLKGKNKNLNEYQNDVEYFMFQKCIRGDAGDNVMSAFPRVRAARIQKAYTDPFEKVQLMNEMWRDDKGNEFIVKKLFEENKLLMDLEYQPDVVKQTIDQIIDKEIADTNKFSYFHFMRFLGKYELKKVSQSVDQYVGMLSK